MARYLLIHGAWHGGWCWEDVAPRLRAMGHVVLAPDLPGMGADAASGHVATLDEWAMFVAGMAAGAKEPAILVGHSRGGIVISRAAELAPPGAIAQLVYLTAIMAPPGATMGEAFAMAGEGRVGHAAGSITVAQDGRTSLWHDPQTATRAFYGACPPDRAAAAFARLSPEPTSMRDAPVLLSPERYGAVPRHYIFCDRDEAVVPELQRAMVAAQPCPTSTLDTDHSPFYSTPDQLAAMLDEIGREGAPWTG
jgi:pimeloyl-ACP methyl ester carboxylesterase